jgi:glutamate formiminotransferase/formiminotetrahydrofolate cyclodeaminase
VGARRFLVAYNVNLNTDAAHSAAAIACEVREKGHTAGDGSRRPGLLKAVKAIGWTIEEYGIAQVSMNLCDLTVTPLHAAFEAVCGRAQAHGLRVTGSELVGLVPLQAMLDAGNYFLEKQPHTAGATEEDLVQTAVRYLGLDELAPFDSKKRIVEYALGEFKDLKI